MNRRCRGVEGGVHATAVSVRYTVPSRAALRIAQALTMTHAVRVSSEETAGVHCRGAAFRVWQEGRRFRVSTKRASLEEWGTERPLFEAAAPGGRGRHMSFAPSKHPPACAVDLKTCSQCLLYPESRFVVGHHDTVCVVRLHVALPRRLARIRQSVSRSKSTARAARGTKRAGGQRLPELPSADRPLVLGESGENAGATKSKRVQAFRDVDGVGATADRTADATRRTTRAETRRTDHRLRTPALDAHLIDADGTAPLSVQRSHDDLDVWTEVDSQAVVWCQSVRKARDARRHRRSCLSDVAVAVDEPPTVLVPRNPPDATTTPVASAGTAKEPDGSPEFVTPGTRVLDAWRLASTYRHAHPIGALSDRSSPSTPGSSAQRRRVRDRASRAVTELHCLASPPVNAPDSSCRAGAAAAAVHGPLTSPASSHRSSRRVSDIADEDFLSLFTALESAATEAGAECPQSGIAVHPWSYSSSGPRTASSERLLVQRVQAVNDDADAKGDSIREQRLYVVPAEAPPTAIEPSLVVVLRDAWLEADVRPHDVHLQPAHVVRSPARHAVARAVPDGAPAADARRVRRDAIGLLDERDVERGIAAHMVELYAVGEEEAPLRHFLQRCLHTVDQLVLQAVRDARGLPAQSRGTSAYAQYAHARIEGVSDVEESVWSPVFGLKGSLDVTAALRLRSSRDDENAEATALDSLTASTACVELKTGRSDGASGVAHRAQRPHRHVVVSAGATERQRRRCRCDGGGRQRAGARRPRAANPDVARRANRVAVVAQPPGALPGGGRCGACQADGYCSIRGGRSGVAVDAAAAATAATAARLRQLLQRAAGRVCPPDPQPVGGAHTVLSPLADVDAPGRAGHADLSAGAVDDDAASARAPRSLHGQSTGGAGAKRRLPGHRTVLYGLSALVSTSVLTGNTGLRR
eukprot:ctg_1225.g449